MPTDRERIATIEQVLREREKAVSEYRTERQAIIMRLDALEDGQSLLMADKRTRDGEIEHRQKRIELRIQVLTAVVALAAVVEPLIYQLH